MRSAKVTSMLCKTNTRYVYIAMFSFYPLLRIYEIKILLEGCFNYPTELSTVMKPYWDITQKFHKFQLLAAAMKSSELFCNALIKSSAHNTFSQCTVSPHHRSTVLWTRYMGDKAFCLSTWDCAGIATQLSPTASGVNNPLKLIS